MGRGIIREKTPISLLIMGGAFLANYMFQINAVYIIFILYCTWLPADLVSEKEDTLMIYLAAFFSVFFKSEPLASAAVMLHSP